ncbi:MAG: serine hydrolase [Deltaproteobacteria bacterium]|nr:serine hydrolase [Deltaproteobacteria bacterium]
MLALLVAWVLAAPAPATPDATVAGRYHGQIRIPGAPLDVEVTLTQQDGALAGSITIPAQGARDLPLNALKRDGNSLSFAMAGIPGDPVFNGKLDGARLEGTFTQGGQVFPFALLRRDPLAEAVSALAGLDAFTETALAAWDVPGAAVAVVRGGQVVLVRGWGVRDVERKLPVTGKTLFAIGSSTKAFTAMVLGTLVEEGRLEWDRPVAQYLKGFQMRDAYAAQNLTPRDMLTHVSGLPRHDLSWYNNTALTREDVVRRLAFLEPNRGMLREFQYNNLMFMAAGHLVEKLTGKSWEQATRERVLVPLRMGRSNFTVKDSQKDPDHAEPYEERDDKVVRIPFRDITTAGPAGSINSCAEDMARWLLLHLSGGTVDGRKVVSPATLRELHTPRVVIPQPPEDSSVPLTAYAPGWFVDVYRGHRRIQHGGNIDGFSALVAVLPDDGTGVVVLTNRSGNGLPGVLVKTITDRLLALPERDWNLEGLQKRARYKALEQESKARRAEQRRPGTRPSRPLADYAGSYRDDGYGPLEITRSGDALVARFNNMDLPLEHWHFDTFRAAKNPVEPEAEGILFTFVNNADGDVERVDVPMEVLAPPVRFLRRPDARLSDPRFLALLAGDYDLAGRPLTFTVRGNALFLSAPGGNPVELIPGQGSAFSLKGITGVRLEFVVPPDGKPAAEVKLTDPDGTVSARRLAH